MTAPEEAELERRARTDPDLREAWEGLQAHVADDHAPHLARMVARARPTATRRTLFRRYAAAATVLVLLGIAVLLLPRYFTGAEEAPLAMETDAAEEPESFPSNPSPALPAPKVSETVPPEEPADASASAPAARVASAPPAVESEEVALNDAEANTEGEAAPRVLRKTEPPPVEEDVDRNAVPAPPLQAEPVPLPATPAAASLANRTQTVTGRVTDEDGAPITEAQVKRRGLPTGTTTDSTGRFALPYDATLDQIVITYPGYEEETIDVVDTAALMQISLTETPTRARFQGWTETASVTRVPLDDDLRNRPQARPVEGYRELRTRIENERPEGLPAGKVRVNFLVNPDGSLSDFRFRGRPDRATMDYVGNALVETSTWEVVKTPAGEGTGDPIAPVRVYLTLRFE